MSQPEPAGLQCLADQAKSELSPAQQVKLLELSAEALRAFPKTRDLTLAVLARLRSSTVRASSRDCAALVERRYAVRKRNGRYAITGLGRVTAGALAQDLAKEFEVVVPEPRRKASATGEYSAYGCW